MNKTQQALEALDYCEEYIKGSSYEKYSDYKILKSILNKSYPQLVL